MKKSVCGQLLGIDIGTTGTKSLVLSEDGEILAKATFEYSVEVPRSGYVEQNPQIWWKGVVSTVKEVLTSPRVRREKLIAIGLSGQMHTAVLLNKNGRVLRPSITWMDQRSAREVNRFIQDFGIEELLKLTMNFPAPMYTASQLMWIKEHEPDLYKKIWKILIAKDFIKFLLIEECSTDYSDASGTYLFDVANLKWADELVQYLNLRKEQLPFLSESIAIVGRVTPKAARATGIPVGTPVIAGSADQAAGAVGGGIVREGQVASLLGTAGVVSVCSKEPRADSKLRLLCWKHAVPGLWQILGVMQTAAICLKWFHDVFEEEGDYSKYDMLIENVPPGAGGLIFLPYLMGERTPYWDPRARGILFGLLLYHSRSHIIRAIYEGVAHGIYHIIQIMEEIGVAVNEIRALGGGNRSKIWRQIQANMIDNSILYPNATEGSAFGAAILAAVGVGLYETVQEATDKLVAILDRREPDPKAHRLYAAMHDIYTSLYEVNKVLFYKLGTVVAEYMEKRE